MLVYRIVHKAYSQTLFAPGISGRWNGKGRKVVYTAESVPLAFLENMIRRKGVGFNGDFKIMIIEIPDTLSITEIKETDMKNGWRDFTDYSKCQPLGNAWYDKSDTPVLKVPSAVLPGNFNYVLNPMHPHYTQIALIETTNLVPDERIEDILKRYR
ncbi:RES family NAD+ phosphorylase [Agriterribacter sp.]|uniref:RES family NAD+ phosphorylase n=1 Tax=Agriterribacter sp. TaxID=2821509 RepID=UPI002C48A560|nr:RES family NAD+ phosphorylase [Agriterribacter sp.]HTN08089.1 RES family NAD+ phosphorylase [Agriterribacter sp.]